MFSWFRQWNKFDNRSIFDEIKAYKKPYKTKGVSFLDHPVYELLMVRGFADGVDRSISFTLHELVNVRLAARFLSFLFSLLHGYVYVYYV